MAAAGAAWPDLTEYHEAVQQPGRSFNDKGLKYAKLELDRFGMPKPATGANAVVYKAFEGGGMLSSKKTWAIRCFLRPISDHAERYDAISRQLNSMHLPYGVGFNFLKQGIQIRNQWFPIVKMLWVEGDLMHNYVEKNLKQPAALNKLRESWRTLVSRLESAKIAHGDLQHGNILIVNGSFFLVDYDGTWVPALKGRQATELGHRNYQHPDRNETDFGPELDRFSSLLIYLSLAALERNPKLWEQYHNGDNLIFVREDLTDPGNTPVWKGIAQIGYAPIDRFAKILIESLQKPAMQVPNLETVLRSINSSTSPANTVAAKPLPAKVPPPPPPPPKPTAVKPKTPPPKPIAPAPKPLPPPPTAPINQPGAYTASLPTWVNQQVARSRPLLDQVTAWKVVGTKSVASGGSRIVAMQMSTDGKLVALVTAAGEMGLWHPTLQSFTTAPEKLTPVQFGAIASKKPIALIAATNNNWVVDFSRWQKSSCSNAANKKIISMAVTANGERGLIACQPFYIEIINLANRKVVKVIDAKGSLSAALLSDDAHYLFCGTEQGTTHLIHTQKGASKASSMHSSPIRQVATSIKSQYFAAGDQQGKVTVWSNDLKQLSMVEVGRSGVSSLCFIGELEMALAVGCSDGTIKIISTTSSRVLRELKPLSSAITALAYLPNHPGLAFGTVSGQAGFIAT